MTDTPAASGDLDDVRAFLRAHRGPTVTVGGALYQLYLTGLFSLYVAAALSGSFAVETTVASAALGVQRLEVLAPPAAALVLLSGLRLGTWAGPVLLTRPEATWLLPAPVSRARLLRPRLVLALAVGAGAGAVLGVATAIVTALVTSGGVWPVLGAAVGSWTCLGILTVVVAWVTERSSRTAATVLTAGPALLTAALGLGWAARSAPGLVQWSGPWGWATQSLVEAARGGVVGWGLAPLAAAAVAASIWALVDVPRVHDEELARRGGMLTAVRSSAGVLDLRAVGFVRRGGQRTLRRVRTTRLPVPRRRWLATPWRDATALLREPGRLGWSLGGATVAVTVVGAAPRNGLALLAAACALYLAAAQLLEPMRVEIEDPAPSALLATEHRRLVAEHVVTPAAALVLLSTTVIAGAAALGVLPTVALAPALAATPGVVLLAILGAAVAAHRGETPLHLLAMGDQGAGLLVLWFALGPIVTAAALTPPALAVGARLTAGDDVWSLVAQATMYAVAVSGVGAVLLARRLRTRLDGAGDKEHG